MARTKKQTLNISDFLGLKWEEQEPEIAEIIVIATCNFCKRGIKSSEPWFSGILPDGLNMAFESVATACRDCVTAAGIKW